MEIGIRSFNGIGDLLFVTPTLRRIKDVYSNASVVVNTNYPGLLAYNPYVNRLNVGKDGVFLGYPDPIHGVYPTKHHIISDWEIVSREYGLELDPPDLKPEIHLPARHGGNPGGAIGVQVLHKGHWHAKKIWPWFDALAKLPGFEPIRKCAAVTDLVKQISQFRAVVCAEGGISHIARALDVPAVVIYGGFAKPEWNGYEEQINLCNPLDCSYCYNPGPCTNAIERRCMREISIESVVEAAHRAVKELR
jgi:ADP-heptose:LPS heptosyltransferase